MLDLIGSIRFIINLILYPFAVTFLVFYRCLQWLSLQPIIYDYKDHIVLITGSANGLGREIALAFARNGASLTLWDIDDAGNHETQQQCLAILSKRNTLARVRTYHVDVTRAADVYACAERVRRDLGQVTILVTNAGFVSGRTLLNESDIDIQRTFDTNSLSPIWLIKAFLPYMLDANRGHIVIVSSILGIYACHGPITYISSKHASLGLSRSLRFDIHATHPNTRVSIHCVCPYLMQTRMFRPVVNQAALKSLLPVITPQCAANQILNGIEWRRNEIIIPNHLRYVGFITDFLLPQWLSEWLLFTVSGRQPLNAFHRNNEETISEKRKKLTK